MVVGDAFNCLPSIVPLFVGGGGGGGGGAGGAGGGGGSRLHLI